MATLSTRLNRLQSKNSTRLTLIVLVIVHQVGVIGLHLGETRDLFQQLVPFNLLFSVSLLLLFHQKWTTRFGVFCFVIFWAGYLVELLGVSTNVIFGPYHYDTALGFKVGGVPPLIGVNWLMLVYISGVLVQDLGLNIWLRSALAAGAMVLLDLLIEPMAVRYDFWTWDTVDSGIPAQNFLAWYMVSYVMSYFFQKEPGEKSNPIAVPLYLVQFFFFFSFFIIEQAAK
ncbi:MAG: carotenoid biosynthesis protein [Bacteroidota bacterium]